MYIFTIPLEPPIGQEQSENTRFPLDRILDIGESLNKLVIFGASFLRKQSVRACSKEEFRRDIQCQPEEQILQVDRRTVTRDFTKQVLKVFFEQVPVPNLRAHKARSQHVARMLPFGPVGGEDAVSEDWP